MKINAFDASSRKHLGAASSERGLSSLLKKHGAVSVIGLSFDLGIPLDAMVMRVKGEPETVILASDGKEHWASRSVRDDTDPEKLGVTCCPTGDVVPVDSINLPFRPGEDAATDRGIVWISPGLKASAHLLLKPANIGGPDKPFDIVTAARQTVQSRVLDKLAH